MFAIFSANAIFNNTLARYTTKFKWWRHHYRTGSSTFDRFRWSGRGRLKTATLYAIHNLLCLTIYICFFNLVIYIIPIYIIYIYIGKYLISFSVQFKILVSSRIELRWLYPRIHYEYIRYKCCVDNIVNEKHLKW